MKISNMALKNIKGNMYRYIMYYLSNSFAVTAFFIFANFIFHPAIDLKSCEGHAIAKMGAANGMIISQVIIVIFSVLFVGYSTSIFLKSRGKEFGLLSLYGMTRKQIKKYLLIENTFISILSIATGILTGVVFSKLFFMIMEGFLNIKLPLHISFKAIGLTTIIFFALFEIISIFMLFRIKNKEIIEQVKSSKVPKTIPEFSKGKAILGVVLLIIGYTVAWFVEGILVPLAMIPVVLIVIAATYFLFTQFSIAIANKILNNENILYKKTNMVAYSQMIFKLQDTAKVLFLAYVLGTITFSATGTIYSFYTEVSRITGLETAHEMVIVQKGDTLADNEVIRNVERKLEDNNIKVRQIYRVEGRSISSVVKEGEEPQEFFVMSNSDYNRLAKTLGKKLVNVKENQVIYNHPYNDLTESEEVNDENRKAKWDEIGLNIGGDAKKFKLEEEIHGQVIAVSTVGYSKVLILNDRDFDKVLKSTNKEDVVVYNGMNLENWKRS